MRSHGAECITDIRRLLQHALARRCNARELIAKPSQAIKRRKCALHEHTRNNRYALFSFVRGHPLILKHSQARIAVPPILVYDIFEMGARARARLPARQRRDFKARNIHDRTIQILRLCRPVDIELPRYVEPLPIGFKGIIPDNKT